MPIRDRIRPIKHLQSKYFICVLENPIQDINVASTLRNISAFGVEKLYMVGNKNYLKDFETIRNNKRLTKLSVGSNRWVFVKQFDTTKECVEHLRKNGYTLAVTSPHQKGKNNIDLYEGTYTQKKLSVWFGSESKGITDVAVNNSDMCIQIPMVAL